MLETTGCFVTFSGGRATVGDYEVERERLDKSRGSKVL